MILNLNDIQRIRNFILIEPIDEEKLMCLDCYEPEENIVCKNQNICLRYTPIEMNEEIEQLVVDLFDTIEFLTNKEK